MAELADRPGLPPFPGAVGVSHLRVYDTTAPDGVAGGTPHLHTACTEAYVVVGGAGAVQAITRNGYREVPLRPDGFVWFTPGTIHRLVNDGDLEILVLMQNDGLPEAGDMVITFDPATRSTTESYTAAADLPPAERTTEGTGDAARQRRDRAVEWYTELRTAVRGGDFVLLDALYADAARLVAGRVEDWRGVVRQGPIAATEVTTAQLDALAAGDPSHLRAASIHSLEPEPDVRRMGCCGTLGTLVADFAIGGITDG